MNNQTDRDFTLTIGGAEVACRVPLHMSARFTVHNALIAGSHHEQEGLAICCAILGLCWAGDLDVPSLRSVGYDLVEYGEHVYDAFYMAGLAQADDLVDAAVRARAVVVETIPTDDEVEEATAPFEATADNSIGTM